MTTPGSAIALAIVAASAAVTGVGLRRRLYRDATGPDAVLWDAVLAIATILVASELLGTVGWFRPTPLAAALVTSALVTGRRTSAPQRDDRRAPHTQSIAPLAGALLCAAVVGAQWSARAVGAFRNGIGGDDSLQYHLPFAARFAQTGWVTRLHFTAPDSPTPFHPAGAELLHAVGMVFLRSDIASVALNLGWLALALLAAWCVGRSLSESALVMASIAVLLATPLASRADAGTAGNDVAIVALLLASVAALRRERLDLAGVAAGLALSVKLTALAPVAVLTIALVLTHRRDIARAARWVVTIVVTGSFWYVRNTVRAGSPLPTVHLGVGPIALPTADLPLVDRFGYSVAHYATDVSVWRHWFAPGLSQAFGRAVLVILAAALVGAVLAVVRPTGAADRVIGIAAVAAMASYVVTPTTAFGASGQPILFAANLRYLTPGLALGLALLPGRVACGRRARRVFAGAIVLTLAATLSSRGPWPAWPRGDRVIGVAFATGALLAVVVLGVLARRRPTAAFALCTAAVLAGSLAMQPLVERHDRYAYIGSTGRGALYAWATHVDGARIAVVGFHQQYPLYGPRLTNRVQYVGSPGPHGAFGDDTSCRDWLSRLARGRFDYVAVSPLDFETREPVQAAWAAGAGREVLRSGLAAVYHLDGRSSSGVCHGGESATDDERTSATPRFPSA